MTMNFVLLVLVLVSAVECFLYANDQTTVNTTIGQIRGVKRHVGSVNQDIYKFLGVPYAKPPVGSLRFQPPKPMPYQEGVFDASRLGSLCPQDLSWMPLVGLPIPNLTFTEDCLTLNAFVPAKSPTNGKPLATLIWFHGGGLTSGPSSIFDPSVLATIGNVIVVTLNYRLGILGFLTNEEKSCPGNFGIWDQRLALLWVHDNIAKFGGDPSKVTLFGESSGAMCVSLHTLLPKNVGLFQHAISQSGSALIPGTLIESPKSWFNLFAQRIKCDDGLDIKTSAQIMQCLRSKSEQEIMQIQLVLAREATEFLMWPAIGKLQWGPWVDGDLIPEEPAKIIQKFSAGRLNMTIPLADVDIIIGVNSQEGALFYVQQLLTYSAIHGLNRTYIGISENVYKDFMRSVVYSVTGNKQSAFADMYEVAIDHEYRIVKAEDATDINRTVRFTKVLADLTFNMGVISFARVHANLNDRRLTKVKKAKTFFYYFDHRGSWQSKEPWRTGADHGDDLYFVFGQPYELGLRSTSAEQSLSAAMMTMWSNFAKTGDPNLPTQFQFPSAWPQFSIENEDYLLLRDDYTSLHPVGRRLHKSRIYFWTDYFPRLRDTAPKNCKPSK